MRAPGFPKEDGSTHIGIRATTYSAEESAAGLWEICGFVVKPGIRLKGETERRHICFFIHEPCRALKKQPSESRV